MRYQYPSTLLQQSGNTPFGTSLTDFATMATPPNATAERLARNIDVDEGPLLLSKGTLTILTPSACVNTEGCPNH